MKNNLEEYLSPETYDAEYGCFEEDYNIFLSLKTQGFALDLACGTGRIAIPLAKLGLKVTGIDASLPMLKRAKQKSQNLPITLSGDIRKFDLNQKFDLVTMAGNSFQALLNVKEQEDMIMCVTKHLSEDGLFIFNTRNLTPDEIKTTDNFEYWHSFCDFEGKKVNVFGKQTFELKNNTVYYSTKRIWPDKETICEIKLKFTAYEDIIKLLATSGLEVLEVYGDFDKSAFNNNSPAIIPVCRLKK